MHIAHARHRRAHAASPLPRRDREELTCVCWRLFVFFALSIAGSAAATAAEKNYVFLRFFAFFLMVWGGGNRTWKFTCVSLRLLRGVCVFLL